MPTGVGFDSIEYIVKPFGSGPSRPRRSRPPPRPAGQAFDVILALSVLTHMRVDSQQAWMPEFDRLLKPGGLVILTLHGDASVVAGLSKRQHRRYLRGEAVVVGGRSEGTNFCRSYHPAQLVSKNLARPLEVIEFKPQGATGNPPQDLWVLRRTEREVIP